MTAADIIEHQIPIALKKRPELAADIHAIIHFEITDAGAWTMDLTKESEWITPGTTGEPALTIIMNEENFVKLRTGELNGTLAVMSGKLQFKPFNLPLAMKVAKLMG